MCNGISQSNFSFSAKTLALKEFRSQIQFAIV